MSGYAVGLPGHAAAVGGRVWFGGGKLAADLTLPRLRHRWPGGPETGPLSGEGLPPAAARAVLRNAVSTAAGQAGDESGFFDRLRDAGVLVRLRFSQACPGQVTGYAVALPGHDRADGTPVWYGGGRLAAALASPRLRRGWNPSRNAPGRPGAFRFTVSERDAIFDHAARQAGAAAAHIRRAAHRDPDTAVVCCRHVLEGSCRSAGSAWRGR